MYGEAWSSLSTIAGASPGATGCISAMSTVRGLSGGRWEVVGLVFCCWGRSTRVVRTAPGRVVTV